VEVGDKVPNGPVETELICLPTLLLWIYKIAFLSVKKSYYYDLRKKGNFTLFYGFHFIFDWMCEILYNFYNVCFSFFSALA